MILEEDSVVSNLYRPTRLEGPMAEPPPPSQAPSHCLLCGQLGPVLSHGYWICEHCKIVVQAEVLSKKLKIEKEGGPT